MFARETVASNVKVEVIEYSYVYCTIDSSIDNARWRIDFGIINRGTENVQITHVFVSNKEVNKYGIVAGDKLENGSLVATSLPVEGIKLTPGEKMDVSVWVGEKLFSSGTTILLNVNTINNVTQYKTIKLV